MHIGFRVRLRTLIGKPLNTDQSSLPFLLAGREVTIKSQTKDQPLSKSKWIIFGSQGFENETQANEFGVNLRLIAEVAAFCSRLGIDVGQDEPSSCLTEEFARSSGFIQPDERICPNIHGLLILPDDEKTRIPQFSGQGSVMSNPSVLLDAMSDLSNSDPRKLATALPQIRLLNSALMNSEPLAQIVLAISAIEPLGQEGWSEEQSALIERLAREALADARDVEQTEVSEAILGIHRITLRRGIKRALKDLGLNHLIKEWDRVYGLRSGLFHGSNPLDRNSISQLATDALNICGKIVLERINKHGVTLPANALSAFQ